MTATPSRSWPREPRPADYTFHLPTAAPPAPPAAEPPPAAGFTRDGFTEQIPQLTELLAPLVGKPVHALAVGVSEGRSAAWLLGHVLIHPDATLTGIDPFAGDADREERFQALHRGDQVWVRKAR